MDYSLLTMIIALALAIVLGGVIMYQDWRSTHKPRQAQSKQVVR